MEYTTSYISEYLLSKGIKPSQQRIAIMRYMMENRIHPTVDDIYTGLIHEYPTLSKTTVYNTVWLFAETGAVESLNIDRNNTRFDYCDFPHAHFLCTGCGEIHDVELNIHPRASTSNNISDIESVSVYFRGTCKKCTKTT